MKSFIAFFSAYVIITFSACSQKVEEGKVPEKIKTSFAKQFPGVTATWEKENGKYEANFNTNNKVESASFELNGTMTESEIEIAETDLPENVRTYVAEHYNDKKIESAEKITRADGSINYEANINNKDLLFDNRGNFVKEAKD